MKYTITNRLVAITTAILLLPSIVCAQEVLTTLDKPSVLQSAQDPLFDCDIRETDSALSTVLEHIRIEYADDNVFLGKLEAAQRAWEEYRLAYLMSRFPEEDVQFHYGSIFSECWCVLYTQKTMERIQELQQWVDKVEEGDVCAGSIT